MQAFSRQPAVLAKLVFAFVSYLTLSYMSSDGDPFSAKLKNPVVPRIF